MERELRVDLSAPQDDQLVGRDYFHTMRPNRKQLVELYLSTLNGHEQETANTLAYDIQDASTPLNDTIALIPVAAHQEAANIEVAMDQYANQQPERPFSVIVMPNAPFDADETAISHTLEEIRKAQVKHSHLDLRMTALHLYEEPSIGTIRRDLWNASMLLSHYEGAFDDPSNEVVGLNHDIDVVRMSPRYIQKVQKKIDDIQSLYARHGLPSSSPSRPHGTFVKHAYDPTHPNVSRAVFWHDFSYMQLRPNNTFDAGLAIPFSFYASRKGIKPDVSIGEMTPLTRDVHYNVVPGTLLETSPRRFRERLQQDGMDQLWGEGTFDANNAYRTATLPDISESQLENAVLSTLDSSINMFDMAAIRQYRRSNTGKSYFLYSREESIAELIVLLERKKRLAVAVLERVVGLPELASVVDEGYVSRRRAEMIVGND